MGLRLPVSSASPKAATLYAKLDADLSCEMILDGTESQLNFTPSCSAFNTSLADPGMFSLFLL